jgi:membrane protease YdiL (CAAX protease family)
MESLEAVLVFALPLLLVIPLYAAGFLTEVAGHYVLYPIYIVGSIIQIKCNGRALVEIGLTRKGLLPSLGNSTLLVAAAFVARLVVADPRLSPEASSLEAIIYNLLYWSLSGVGQEILFRGLILFSFERWKGWKVALAVSTVLFGLIHLQRYQSVSGLLLVSMVGALWGWIALKTKNIVGTAAAHSLFNFLFAFLVIF